MTHCYVIVKILIRPYVRYESYDETFTTSRQAFEEETHRECMAYAIGDGLWKKQLYEHWDTKDSGTRFTEKDFKYTWKPIDCNIKAPFLCQYNQGSFEYSY